MYDASAGLEADTGIGEKPKDPLKVSVFIFHFRIVNLQDIGNQEVGL